MVHPQSLEGIVWGRHRREAAPNQTLGRAWSRNGPLGWKTGQPSSCDFPPGLIQGACSRPLVRSRAEGGGGKWVSGDPAPFQSLRSAATVGLKGLEADVLRGGSGSRNAGGPRGGAATFQGRALTQPRLLPPTQQVCQQPKQKTCTRIPKVSHFPCPFWGQVCLRPVLVPVPGSVPWLPLVPLCPCISPAGTPISRLP